MTYFIHVRDASFHAPPWPGEYRIGPFESEKQARLQEAQERAHGKDVVGIVTGRESEARRGED